MYQMLNRVQDGLRCPERIMSTETEFLINGRQQAELTLVLAHGAGAAMDTPFMQFFADRLAGCGYRVVRFEFPYMAERRRSGKRSPPNRAAVLARTWVEVIDQFNRDSLIVGGKSMGGRIASMVADANHVRGVVCLGYPFHPPGKPERLRIDHLRQQQTPTLILQGTRDPFGSEDEVPDYPLAASIAVDWLADGDHSFKPRKSSGRTEEQNLDAAVLAIDRFCSKIKSMPRS